MKSIFRPTILCMLICMLCNQIQSQTIDVNEARKRAAVLYSENSMGPTKSRQRTPANIDTIKLAYTAQAKDSVFYYVFNYPNGGYSIIGGDEKARTVLGYCPEGVFDLESIPDGLRYMLECYEEQIRGAMIQSATTNADAMPIRRAKASDRTDIEPMLTTKWGQSGPFNRKIPKGSQGSMPTGCTPTATAQVMNYYKYPEKGFGYKAYQINYDNGEVQESLTFEANFGQTTYEWDKMPDQIKSNKYTEEEADALSTLLYHVGVAVYTNYQNGASGASIKADPMNQHFGYNKSAYSWFRDYVESDEEWEQIIYNQLAEKHPVIYNGYSKYAGHCFVCDGYQVETNLYHINWGWSGSCDGYFSLTGNDALNSGLGQYSSTQWVMLDFYPDTEPIDYIPIEKIELGPDIQMSSSGTRYNLPITTSPTDATFKIFSLTSDNPFVATGSQLYSDLCSIEMHCEGIAVVSVMANDNSGVKQTHVVAGGRKALLLGDADAQSNALPFGNEHKYSTVVMEFTPDEIGRRFAVIDSIAFKVTIPEQFDTDIEIYMSDKENDAQLMTAANLVYSGHRTLGTETGWEVFTLDKSMFYTGGTLQVAVVHRSATTATTLNFACTKNAADSPRTQYRASDTDARYADPTCTSYFTNTELRPQVILGYKTYYDITCGDNAWVRLMFEKNELRFKGKGAIWSNWTGLNDVLQLAELYNADHEVQSLYFEPGITSIPASVFGQMNGPKRLTLCSHFSSDHSDGTFDQYDKYAYPGLEQLEDHTFERMTSLERIELGYLPPQAGPNTFAEETLSKVTIYAFNTRPYTKHDYWKNFKNAENLYSYFSHKCLGAMGYESLPKIGDLIEVQNRYNTLTSDNDSSYALQFDYNSDKKFTIEDIEYLCKILLKLDY